MGLYGDPDQELRRIQETRTDAELRQEQIRDAYDAVVETRNWLTKFLEAFAARDVAEVQRLWNFKDLILDELGGAVDCLRRAVQSDGLKRAGHDRDPE